MHVTLHTREITTTEVRPYLDPKDGGPFCVVESFMRPGASVYTHVSPEGVDQARAHAAALNAAADAVEAEQERRERGNGAVPIESLAPEPVDPVDPVAESLDRESVEVAGA